MTTLREAAQQALVALNCIEYSNFGVVEVPCEDMTESAITALRTALAEHQLDDIDVVDMVEQEPVAWGMRRPDGLILDVICPEEHARMPGEYTTPLYTAPQPAKQPLPGEALEAIGKQQDPPVVLHHNVLAFARAIERAHGIGETK